MPASAGTVRRRCDASGDALGLLHERSLPAADERRKWGSQRFRPAYHAIGGSVSSVGRCAAGRWSPGVAA